MEDRRFIISEAAMITGLEPHVLRYWEGELGLSVPRNELGHRFYTKEQIDIFLRVKELKEKGFQLKAIKNELSKNLPQPVPRKEICVNTQEDKMEQFKSIIGSIVTDALRENNVVFRDELSNKVSDKVIKEMDYLIRMKEESEEERFKKLDETIRNCQRSNKEAAASGEKKRRRRR